MGGIWQAEWLIVGLGNPGPRYAGTRHNVGCRVLEHLAAEGGLAFAPGGYEAEVASGELAGVAVLLLKPQAFMNRSGSSVAAWLGFLDIPAARLVVVHDDLDLPLGRLRVVGGAGAAGHRGVASIQEALGTQAFPRVRVGIGRPREGEEAAERVLEEFAPEELPTVAEVVNRAAGAVRALVCEGLTTVMDRYNVRRSPDAGGSAQGGESPERR